MASLVKPVARKNGLVVQEVAGEILVYDLESNKAHCLNESAARVWNSCDGENSIHDLSLLFAGDLNDSVAEEFIWLAIDQLREIDLLVQNELVKSNISSRREVIKKIGLGCVVALPIVASLVAPTSALASSSCLCPSTDDAECGGSCPPYCTGPGPTCTSTPPLRH